MPKIEEAQFQELKRKHPDAVLLEGRTSGHDVVVRPPNEATWMKYQTTGMKGAEAYVSTRNLLFDCLIAPDKSTMDRIIESRPATMQRIVRELTKLAGSEDEYEVKS